MFLLWVLLFPVFIQAFSTGNSQGCFLCILLYLLISPCSSHGRLGSMCQGPPRFHLQPVRSSRCLNLHRCPTDILDSAWPFQSCSPYSPLSFSDWKVHPPVIQVNSLGVILSHLFPHMPLSDLQANPKKKNPEPCPFLPPSLTTRFV